MEFVNELRLGDKLLPHRNPDIAWFWIFLPAMICYLTLLMQSLNGKPFIGSIESYDSEFDKFAASVYPIEVIATGMKWAEGPLWIDNDDSMPYLLYSDTAQNRIYKWEEGKGFFTVGKTMYLPKSGCREESDDNNSSVSMNYCDSLVEPGSSGLARVYAPTLETGVSAPLDMLVCQHGMRSIALQRDNGTRSIVVSHFKDKRLNSPSDMAWSPEGHLYFTDPDFGLERKGQEGDLAEQPVSGLYMVHANDIAKAVRYGEPAKNVFLIDGKMSHPKGLAFSPGYSRLYVSNADPSNAYWKVFDVNSNGLAHKGRLFYNATTVGAGASSTEMKGKPGGIKVDRSGNIYAAGPGGVFVFDPEAKLLGKFKLDREVTGVEFGTDGRMYMTAEDALLRKWLKSKPAPKPAEAVKVK